MEPSELNARLRALPSVDEVLRSEGVAPLLDHAPRWAVVEAVREEVARLRATLVAKVAPGDGATAALAVAADAIARSVEARLRPSLVPVLNGTGVVLHTNLGRAPLAREAIEAVIAVGQGYSNLEYDLASGARGSRHVHAAEILRELTGAEDALVVNNNAAAVLLALAATAAGREVVVSRGELVEIGGAFRVPDVMAASGARLVEVGTTNRTHPEDYRRAISPATGALLKVHRSNFAIVGFTAEVELPELGALAHEHALPLLVDLGSGSFVNLAEHGLPREPTVREIVAAGADLVTFSGDKLLGGPQAGLIVGTRERLGPLRRHPLLRAVRPDKLTIAALVATLALYRDGRPETIPAVGMLLASHETLAERAALLERLARRALEAAGLLVHARLEIVQASSAVGGGALPLAEPPSLALAVSSPNQRSAEAIERALRAHIPPVIGRIAGDRLLLDVRTLRDDDLPLVASAICRALEA